MKKTASPMRIAGSQLRESRHVCAFFNGEDEKHRVLLPFIKDRFDCGDKAVHVVNPDRRKLLRKEQPHSCPSNVNELVQELTALLQAVLREVTAQTQLADNLPFVVADRVQLQQVLLNLIVNAVEAMKSVSDRPRVLRIKTNRDVGNRILVSIQDSGPGLNADRMQKLLSHSTPPNPKVSEWGCPSAAPSLSGMADAYGRNPMKGQGRLSSSAWPVRREEGREAARQSSRETR